MNAAVAALVGAAIGLTGTVIAPLVAAWQARRAQRESVKRDAYAQGHVAIAQVAYAKSEDDRKDAAKRMLMALANIEMFGSRSAAKHFNDAIEAMEPWVTSGGALAAFGQPAKDFQEATREETGADTRRERRELEKDTP